MGDDVDVDVLLFGRIKEREAGGGPLAFAFKGNHRILEPLRFTSTSCVGE